MARFLQDTDYDALIRSEITTALLENYTDAKMLKAEDMAVSQIKNYISGFYDVEAIFTVDDPLPSPDPRNAYIVMITIDCALYHLYTSTAPDRIPEHRALRYNDALEWLKGIAEGKKADLPEIVDEDGKTKSPIRIASKYAPENNKW